MKIEKTQVFNLEGAIRGMRNPLSSWQKSDSYQSEEGFIIGPNDMGLATRLIKGGSEHRKFLRQIFVCVDLTAPMYLWSEIDTYKVATAANSTSKMHTIMREPFTKEMFEMDDFQAIIPSEGEKPNFDANLEWDIIIMKLNALRNLYLETKSKEVWKELIRQLPNSWLQTRTWSLNYETLRNIYHQRKGHKLTEWKTVLDWIETLPYAQELIIGNY